MWLSLVENSEAIIAIYKDSLPSLLNLHLHHNLMVEMEPEVSFFIKVDISDLPNELPLEWENSKVNTIQIALRFVLVEMEYLHVNNVNYESIMLSIEKIQEGGIIWKKAVCVDNMQNKIFALKARWIYLDQVSGYKRLSDEENFL